MEIREYAERVLYGSTLSGKLVQPERLTDQDPGEGIAVPSAPTRPIGLMLSPPGTKRPKFPTISELESPEARGRVLHFFANHELLALELMALTLLRFPEAPARFRKRLISTMRDEQKHMRLYLDRMATFGIEMGEIPLNSFFWDQLSQVGTVREFVAGMSLTFEQANLDFSLHYRNVFQTMGDTETATIMNQVLKDEVAHVRHGVDYLNRTRPPNLSQWSDYLAALNYPLTPARAKGNIFTRAHRESAGLEPDFIDQMEVYAHSKGRVPNVYFFNPSTEAALAHTAGIHTPSKPLRLLQTDLESLPMFLAAKDDVVVVEQQPPAGHLAGLQRLGYAIPEFSETRNNGEGPIGSLRLKHRKLGELRPWGWDQNAQRLMTKLATTYTSPKIDLGALIEKRRHLSSKAWLARRLPDLLAALPMSSRAHWVTEPLPTVLTELKKVKTTITSIQGSGYKTVVIKAPLGTAGGAQLRVTEDGLTDAQTRWVDKQIAHQGAVIVEPWYDNVADLSYLFKVDQNGQPTAVGLSHFITDGQGRYRGALLGRAQHTLPSPLKSFISRAGGEHTWLMKTLDVVVNELSRDFKETGFSGLAGIDLMLVRDVDGVLKVRAPLELNPRPTMGHVALALAKPFGSRATGLWLHVTQRDLANAAFPSFQALMDRLHEVLPTVMEGNPARMVQGAFSSNEPQRASQVLGVCLVAKRLERVHEIVSQIFGHEAYAKLTQNRHIED